MGGTRSVTYDAHDWASVAFRRRALRDARLAARKNYCLITIKEQTPFGVLVRATVDGRFWLMDPKDFVEQRQSKPGAEARRALAQRLKAPSFMF